MDTQAKKQLEMTACKVRMGVIEETFQAKSGHPGGSLSVTDLLTSLFLREMRLIRTAKDGNARSLCPSPKATQPPRSTR